ncbi:hypothetical protein CULT_250002 [[Clostridium] ultunense Esp]|nr:hypothetical protein CULT_250002 [[Clostridium] ultunense Esp]
MLNFYLQYSNLTNRENKVANILLKGKTYKMIAEEPYLSENIIKTYVKNIYSKYDVQSKEELIKILAITQKSDGSRLKTKYKFFIKKQKILESKKDFLLFCRIYNI